MAKIPRVFQKQFAQNALSTYYGQFGSKAAGTPITSPNLATIQALVAFTQNGWPDAVNQNNKAPYLEEMNALHYLIFQQLCNIFQDGVPAWEPSTPYYTGSFVRLDGTNYLYSSAVDNNIGNSPTTGASNAYWILIPTTPQVYPGTMADFAGPTPPLGWLDCDGSSYLKSQYPNLFAAIGYTWGGSGANFNVPNMQSRVSIGSGTGGGLSTRVLGQFVGEESHILQIAELPPHAHVDAGHTHGADAGLQFIETSGLYVGSSGPTARMGTNLVSATAVGYASIGNTGSGVAHNNMQPSAVVLKIIKY